MSEENYDTEMVAAFLEPRESENVPAQYAYELARMAQHEHEQVATLTAERDEALKHNEELTVERDRAERVLGVVTAGAHFGEGWVHVVIPNPEVESFLPEDFAWLRSRVEGEG